ncbi:HAD family hydrolase [Haloferax mediterranei ATCC 33500]|uniref:HAD family hydrolase n=1 Tax=Haloferax mediterranei (strain ATCC 33500 / DSM 1411 / JCM 8866 / NBRC 14739 / NCIMB 2177 / R-4) TaxID=523841 RepID=I3R843_HALMT|nr:HAD hydrolase-like protein [Haloferax mediterranei]AFK20403.1 phosphoglycolate phosphatase [Haloferax mediterranei ATCC 33500]AHZ23767.1 phosphoglycolate phosphatase [Haloferax mediterranei ATCC 33500]ELZ99259.1 phosphoglycolate phosphatase [Haloferax mediterranei ATCC 33500]MDX5986841.1 HAD hydrolase-like protein [Haloferax mediterranei ATCC 33500]QCQ76165.1 HAD family hydrolase [Haloferax mediterranei ATCC 33500]
MALPDLSDFDAVVYDLDGTLVNLRVDWAAAAQDAALVLQDAGVEADSMDLWRMLDVADEAGVRDELERELSAHERQGAWTSDRLPLADHLTADGVPSGVCSLNAEDACRVALDVHDLTHHVDALVGRDTVATQKPAPEPLLETLGRMDVDPGAAVFIGDSARDKKTAERADIAFRYVDGGPSGV